MAQTKDEILKVLDNISGPIEATVIRDLVNSILEFVEAQAIGTIIETSVEATIDPNYVDVTGDEMTGDLEFTANTDGPIVLDRTNANRYRLYMNNGVFTQEIVT